MAYHIETNKQEQRKCDDLDRDEVSCNVSLPKSLPKNSTDAHRGSSQEQVIDKVKDQRKKVEKSPPVITTVDKYEVESSQNRKVDKQENNKMENYLLQTLDEIERRTEKLRQTVGEVEAERLYLLQSLDTLMQSQALGCTGERDELELYTERLINRLLTINISVQIIRNPPQEKSLQRVKTLLGKLQTNMRQGDTDSGAIHRYLNSCLEQATGPVDEAFQGALLGCAAEDQKEIRKILTSMWEAKDDVDRQMSVLASMSLS